MAIIIIIIIIIIITTTTTTTTTTISKYCHVSFPLVPFLFFTGIVFRYF
jgi:hypothetical protein